MTTEHRESIIALSDWMQSPAGRYVLAWEEAQFDALVADVFGYNAVQIGLLDVPTLRSNRMPFRFGVSEPAAFRPVQGGNAPVTHASMVFSHLEELPFASQCIDLLVLPHALEFADDPHQVLREVERVLIPEGRLIIAGFNPVSLWGLRQLVGRAIDAPFLPLGGQFLSLPRLKDWLKLLGFEVNRGRFGCYRPPFESEQWMGRFGFMDQAGDRWWPFCGAIYMVSAVKRVRSMRLVGPLWRERLAPAPALAPTAQRGMRAFEPAEIQHREAAIDG